MIIFNLLIECNIVNDTLYLLQRSVKFFVCEFVHVYEWLERSIICRDIMAKLLVAFQEETRVRFFKFTALDGYPMVW